MSTKKTLAQLNAELRAKGKKQLKVSAETKDQVQKVLVDATRLHNKVKVSKLVSK